VTEIFRIHSPAYEVFDTTGTALFEGRWHTRGTRLIYTAQHISLAALEILIHAGGRKFPPKVLSRIHLPAKISIEQAGPQRTFAASQRFGDEWIEQQRSAVLRVPSVAVDGLEFNYLLNPVHPDFHHITHAAPVRFPFDDRFFSPTKPAS